LFFTLTWQMILISSLLQDYAKWQIWVLV